MANHHSACLLDRLRQRTPVFTLFLLILMTATQAVAFNPNQVSEKQREMLTAADAASFIIVRLADDSGLIVGDEGIVADPDGAKSGDRTALGRTLSFAGAPLEMRRLFTDSSTKLAAQRRDLKAQGFANVPNLNAYGIVRTPGGVPLRGAELRNLLAKLNDDPAIAIAYPRPHYEVASLDVDGDLDLVIATSDTPSFTSLQGYRGYPYQMGFGAVSVDSWAGSQGGNVKIIDIEGGWHWDHEDLPTPFVDIGTHSALPHIQKHGTSAMGIIAGQDNGFGVKGFVPDAQVGGVVCEVAWDDPSNWVDCSTHLLTALGNLAAGDLILIELHAAVDPVNHTPWLPMEYWPANFEAMRLASLAGVTVVEAAGNGYVDLDDYLVDFVRDDLLLDCGAIMVGAVDPATGQRVGSTNHGERVDVHGWGLGVATAGGGELYGLDEGLPYTRWYRDSFSGTSSASAIMAGVVGSVQSIWIQEQGLAMPARDVRNVLRASGHYTDGVSESIGVRPDIPEFFRFQFDTGAPVAVDNLWVINTSSNTVALGWFAPADDYRDLIVAGYELRYSESPITEANFDLATPFEDVMDPWPPGMGQRADISGLLPATTYYFAIRSYDPGGRFSLISNVASVTTDPPAPQIVIDSSELALGTVRVGYAGQGEITVENIGTADLVIQGCVPYADPNMGLECVELPAAPIPAGATGVILVAATPQTMDHYSGAFMITCNDPDLPITGKGVSVDGGNLIISDVTIAAPADVVVAGTATIENPGSVAASYAMPQPRVAYDATHGQQISDYVNIYMEMYSEFHVAEIYGELTAATLATTDVLHVAGTGIAWTATEIQIVSDWVAAGGGLYVETTLGFGQETSFNPLLEALGLGSPLTFAYDPASIGVTTQLAADELLNGVAELTLSNPLYKMTSTPTGADWLVRTPDGLADKGFRADFGTGRVVVVADNLYYTAELAAAHHTFAGNVYGWLAAWPSWISFTDLSGTVPAGVTDTIDFTVNPAGLTVGTYTFTAPATVLGESAPFVVTLEVVTPAISNIQKLYLEHDQSTVRWDTNVFLPCRFRFRDYGTTTWSAPINRPAGLSFQASFYTQPNHKYDGLIEIMDGENVVLSEQILMKTPKLYPIELTDYQEKSLPAVTVLRASAPNPFNPSTAVRFELAEDQNVRLEVFDTRGRLVRSLLDEQRSAGFHEVIWNGRDDQGRGAGSGIYFVRMQGTSYRSVGKVTLLK
jgi:Subtilase family/FlgD Ig-like domain